MKKILFFLLLISATVTAQRSIPRGGAAGQVLKIANDGYSLKWIDANDSTSNAPLYFADVATTASLSATYLNDTLTATGNGRIGAIDGVTLDSGETILYKNAVAQLQNGVYYVLDTGTAGTPYKLVRADNYNETAEIYPSQVNVINGTVNSGAYYLQTTFNPTIGTSAIVYSSKPAPTMIGGTGVTVTSNTISIGQPVGVTDEVTFSGVNSPYVYGELKEDLGNFSYGGTAEYGSGIFSFGAGYGGSNENYGGSVLVESVNSYSNGIFGGLAVMTGGSVQDTSNTSGGALVQTNAGRYFDGNWTGGRLILRSGKADISGSWEATQGNGLYSFFPAFDTTYAGVLDFSNITSSRLYTFPNASGTVALATSTPTFTSVNTNTITATTYNGIPYQFYLACTDETTAITATDTNSITIYAPFNFTVTSVFGMLRDAQSSGSTFTFDIKKNGTTIFATKPTIDNTHFTTLTASTAAVLSTTTFAAGDRIVINRHQVGTGGKGFKVAINYTR